MDKLHKALIWMPKNSNGWTAQNINLDAKSSNGWTAQNIDLNAKNSNGWTAQSIDLNAKNSNGWTTFIYACKEGHTKVVKLLRK